MTTLTQRIKIDNLKRTRKPYRKRRLKSNPNLRGLVKRVAIMNPKKPNSAMRHVAKLKLYKGKFMTARIPGIGNMLVKFNRVLVRGGRANDLPGVSYSVIRGCLDCIPIFSKKRRRSFYGVPRPKESVTHIRRCLRQK